MNRYVLAVYGVGHFGKTLLWASSGLTFAFFLTEIVGIGALLMGELLALSLLFNAVCDIAVGRWLQSRATDLRSAGVAHAIGALVAAAAFIAFAHTHHLAPEYRVGFVTVTLLLFRLGYSAFDVPQNAMLSFATGNDAMRGTITAVRYVAAGVATIVVALFLSRWIAIGDQSERGDAYVGLAIVVGIVALFTAVATAITVKPVASERAKIVMQQVEPVYQFLPILVSIAIFSGVLQVFTKLQPYFVAFGTTGSFAIEQFIATAAIGQIVSQPLWRELTRRLPLATVYSIGAGSLVVAGCIFTLLAPRGGLGLLGTALFFGASSSGALMAIWSLMASVAAAPGANVTTMFGKFTFVSKSAQALGVLAVGAILQGGAYAEAAGSGQIALWMGLAAMLAGVGCFLASLILRRTHRRSRILSEARGK